MRNSAWRARTEPARAARARYRLGPSRRARVLVVEDDADAGETLAMILEIMGHRAAWAWDGPAALAAAHRDRFDAMLIDIGLPGMDGYELARRVRSDPALRGLVLVAVTGYGAEADRERAAAAGFDRHMLKPANPDELRALLARLDELRPARS